MYEFEVSIKEFFHKTCTIPKFQLINKLCKNEQISGELIKFYLNSEDSRKSQRNFYYPCWFSIFVNSKFITMQFINIEFSSSQFNGCLFENCAFIGCRFVELECDNCTFENCVFLRNDFYQSWFENTTFNECKFLDGTLTLAHFESCNFLEPLFKMGKNQILSGVLVNSKLSNSIDSIEIKEKVFFSEILNQLKDLDFYYEKKYK